MAYTKEYQLRRMSKEVRYEKRRSQQQMDVIDRIRAYLYEDKPLGKRDRQWLDIANIIYPMMCQGFTNREIIEALDEQDVLKKSSGYVWIKRTKQIYGNPEYALAEADKSILIEMAREAYRTAKKNASARDMVAATKLIAELNGSLKEEHNLTLIFDTLQLPALEITTDPKVIDIPYEEVAFEED